MKEHIFYIIVRPILTFIFKAIYMPKIVGSKNIPTDGRIVLAGNHTNNLDCILLISSTKRPIHFLAKDSLYKGWKKPIFKSMGIIPVDRSKKDKSVLINAKKCLENEMVVGVFPEGTINKTKETIMPFKVGAVKMAIDTNSKIVPFIITGKYRPFKRVKIEFLNTFTPTKDVNRDNESLMKIVKEELEKNK